MLRWRIGDVRITRVQELESSGLSYVLREATPANLKEISWLAPHFVDVAGEALVSIHALLVESYGKKILIDTCVGNDKPRPFPVWDKLQTNFLGDLVTAGARPEEIDIVVCTHIHLDHVGWNTRYVGDRWVPTFPNARYLLAEPEWSYWRSVSDDPLAAMVSLDSMFPVFEAGIVDLVPTDHRVNDQVSLMPTPGHTPGHVSVRIRSRGAEGVVTGDFIHHPCQMAHPDWCSHFDTDPEQALVTRRDFLDQYADTQTLVVGSHFAGPTSGLIRRDGSVYRFEV